MKYLPPTMNNGVLKRTQLEVLVAIEKSLAECNGDIDLWCAQLGLDLVRSNTVAVKPIPAYLFGRKVFVREGMTKEQELKAVAHEYAHHMFHVATTPSETMVDVFRINRDEREAKAFAAAFCKDDFSL